MSQQSGCRKSLLHRKRNQKYNKTLKIILKYSPGLYMLTRVSGKPVISGSSPPTTTARAPSRCASRTLFTNSHFPLWTSAIQGSEGSGVFGPSRQRSGHPVFGIDSFEKELGTSQGFVNEDRGRTYPRIGLSISEPNAATMTT